MEIKELEKEKERLKQTIASIDSILQDERINLKNCKKSKSARLLQKQL